MASKMKAECYIKNGTLWVAWNYEGIPYSKCAEWFDTVDSDRKLYSTLTNWDELDEALSLIGAKKVKSSSFGSDWGDGDIDIFTRNVYDFSNVTIN